ncbi:MAG TPA: hypothetical protein VNE82_11355 [Candidatus Binataceae bacterium]|nr:hypothetical protein [Candidatus Binataceae bacterium]
MIEVEALRVSFAWMQPTLDLLAEQALPNAPMRFLGRDDTFGAQFELAQRGQQPNGLEPPWPKPAGQLFWTYYLEGSEPGSVRGTESWRALVPLRLKLAASFELSQLPLTVFAEGFLYPHGFGLGITVELTQRQPIEAVVNALIDLQQKRRLVPPGAQARGGSLKLGDYAAQCLSKLRADALGAAAAARRVTLDQPFSIATIMRANEVAVNAPIVDQGPVHQVLEALTRWSPTWQADSPLPPFAKRRIPTKGNSPPSHALYASKRGRVIWFPAYFGQPGAPNLTCYHRNLFYASLQVESLSALSSVAAESIAGGIALSPWQSDCAKRAAGILGRLYAGASSTYRSMSAKLHIDENRKTEINGNRQYFGMPTL